MADRTAHHIVDEDLGAPGSYLTIRRGDRVYDLYGWAAGHVIEPRIVASRDEFFDGVVIRFRGSRVFVDAPEVRARPRLNDDSVAPWRRSRACTRPTGCG